MRKLQVILFSQEAALLPPQFVISVTESEKIASPVRSKLVI